MSSIITEATLITLLGGFISIISILVKYRLDNKKSIEDIKNLAQEITKNDKRQDERIQDLTQKVEILSANFERFTNSSQLSERILYKYFDMQNDLNTVVINDIKNEKHNGDLEKAGQKIENFKALINNDKLKEII